ncbi:MAG: hypothetical protein BWY65_00438 [Firmicutes bacterium ADurb.Bin373]|nr:hypothetical protein [Bacillota bacterium]OQA10753.1 MAG: hypothetical protein BWY65_00438 [Firmicutes bacterium ADurb.Bin373]
MTDSLYDEIYLKHARELYERLNFIKQSETFEKGEDLLTRLSIETLQQSIKACVEICQELCIKKNNE